MQTSVVPFGRMLPTLPPNRCIARHPRPANDLLEGSPVQGPTRLATCSDSNEPSEFRSAFEKLPWQSRAFAFSWSGRRGRVELRAQIRNRPGCQRLDGN